MNDEDAIRRSCAARSSWRSRWCSPTSSWAPLAGVVWEWLWSPPTQVVQQHQLYYTDYASLRRVFSGTGLYALVSAVASALVALAAALLTRRRELLTLGAVIVGSLAAAYTMHAVGVALGPADPAKLAAVAADGTHVSGQLAGQRQDAPTWCGRWSRCSSCPWCSSPHRLPGPRRERGDTSTEPAEADVSEPSPG